MCRPSLVLIFTLLSIIAAGCNHLPSHPRASVSPQEDAIELQRYMLSDPTQPQLQTVYDTEKRNAFIDNKVILINLRYSEFVNGLASKKRTLDAGYDVLSLGLSVAGTLVGGIQSKENLAAASSLLTGSKVAVDKHFFFEQTIPVLITSMENGRKEVLLRILQGRQGSYDTYPMAKAQTDLAEYEDAGSLTGALRGLASQASARKTELDKELSSLVPATRSQIEATTNITTVVAELLKRNDLGEMNRVLRAVGSEKFDYSVAEHASRALETEYRKMSPDKISKWKAALNIN